MRIQVCKRNLPLPLAHILPETVMQLVEGCDVKVESVGVVKTALIQNFKRTFIIHRKLQKHISVSSQSLASL
jgi:hypothetical protein